jgi:restriction endonuclease
MYLCSDEPKDKEQRDLFNAEEQKIEHARAFFRELGHNVKIEFETQFQGQFMSDIIRSCIQENHL